MNAKRINITLPVDTVQLINRRAKSGERSRLIDQAIHFYLDHRTRSQLRGKLKAGARDRGKRDLWIADQWFSFDE